VKVVLRADVDGVGKKGDVRDVADGFARNYLLPKGIALVATPGVEAQAEAMRRARMLRSAAEKADAQALADLLGAATVQVTAKAGKGGKLFGSVGAADVAAAIAAQTGATIDRRQINLDDPIKTVGSHQVVARLHTDVDATITVDVVAR
jgi:large subunit ribosomal protein L9